MKCCRMRFNKNEIEVKKHKNGIKDEEIDQEKIS